MSSAVDFAVRNSAGATTYGTVAGDGQGLIYINDGDSVSLNISPQSVLSYARQGDDLIVELSDGRRIVLADWFDVAPGIENRLYLSTDGMITEVFLTDSGNGTLAADLSFAGGGEKWSPLDSLRFGDGDPVVTAMGTGRDEPAGMGIFAPALLGLGGGGVGAAALVGGGLLISGGGGGGGGPSHTRTIEGSGTTTTLTTNSTQPPGITVNGTGLPGDSVNVTIGTQSRTVTVGPDGRWTATFTGPGLPPDGNHRVTATFTGNGSTTTLNGGNFLIDMTPPPVTATEGVQSRGHVENAQQHRDGVTLRGTTEPGATVNVTIGIPGQTGAISRPATVNADGTWSITLSPQDIPGGERSQTVTITATDRNGNVRILTETVVLDTIAPPLSLQAVAGDNVVNRAESLSSQTVISGTGTPGSTVRLVIDGFPNPINVTVNPDGTWSHSLNAGQLADGTYRFTATTADAAGNVTTQTGAFRVDTQMSVSIDGGFAGDNTVNLTESRGSLTLTGTIPPDATRVEVTWLGQPLPATLNANGTWSITFPPGTANRTQDSTISVTAWDSAGNSQTTTRPVRIDLETTMTLSPDPVGADRLLSANEQRAGFQVGGEGEPGARIFLSLNGTPHGPVTVGADGRWTHTFTALDLQGLTHGQQVSLQAYAIDAAGNRSATETRNFALDTQVSDFTFAPPDLTGTVNDGPRDANVLNAAERNAGLPLSGTVEPGATIRITVPETGWTTTIPGSQTQSGTWRLVLPPEALPQGAATTANITAVATDAQGNTSAPQTHSINIDTMVSNFTPADIRLSMGTDSTLNAREHALGLPVSGRAEAGSTVSVTMNGFTRTVVVGQDGNWSVTFTPDQIPIGERSGIPVSVTATDPAGNVSGPLTSSFSVDTVAPTMPLVLRTEDYGGGYSAITTNNTNDTYRFHRVDATGAPMAVLADETLTSRGEDRFDFRSDIPDGSYLVINTSDAAGNQSNTLFIKNTSTGVAVDLTREGLQGFDFSAIDLTRAPDARLTITARQLESLVGPDNQLVIRGEHTDHVTLQNVTSQRENVLINGQLYDIFTLGTNGAQVLLEDDVSRTVI